jgi:hypothetical protein
MLVSSEKNLLFKNKINYKKNIDKPFSMLVSAEDAFNLRFWVKIDTKTKPEIDEFLMITKHGILNNGYKLFLNHQNFFPNANSKTHIFNEILHGNLLEFDLTQWTIMSMRVTPWKENGSILFNIELFIGNQPVSFISEIGRFNDSSFPVNFMINFGSFNEMDPFCSW